VRVLVKQDSEVVMDRSENAPCTVSRLSHVKRRSSYSSALIRADYDYLLRSSDAFLSGA
jgi:hypothetical protein